MFDELRHGAYARIELTGLKVFYYADCSFRPNEREFLAIALTCRKDFDCPDFHNILGITFDPRVVGRYFELIMETFQSSRSCSFSSNKGPVFIYQVGQFDILVEDSDVAMDID